MLKYFVHKRVLRFNYVNPREDTHARKCTHTHVRNCVCVFACKQTQTHADTSACAYICARVRTLDLIYAHAIRANERSNDAYACIYIVILTQVMPCPNLTYIYTYVRAHGRSQTVFANERKRTHANTRERK